MRNYNAWIAAIVILLTVGAGCSFETGVQDVNQEIVIDESITVESWQNDRLEEYANVQGSLGLAFSPCVDEARLAEILEIIGPKDEIQSSLLIWQPGFPTEISGGWSASTAEAASAIDQKVTEMEVFYNDLNPQPEGFVPFTRSTLRVWNLRFSGTGAEGLSFRESIPEAVYISYTTGGLAEASTPTQYGADCEGR